MIEHKGVKYNITQERKKVEKIIENLT